MRNQEPGTRNQEPETPDARTQKFDLRALLETSRLLSSSLEIDFVLGNLLLTAMSKLFVTRGVVLLDDPLAGAHRVETVKGIPALAPDTLLQLGAPPRAVVQGDDVPALLRERGVVLLLPVTYHDRAIGLVGLGAKATGGAFTGDEIAFVDSLVHMSATAIHNARMVEELQEANQDLGQKVQQLDTLFDLSQAFSRTLDVERSVRLFSLALMGQLLVGRYVFLLRDEYGRFEAVADRNTEPLGDEMLARLGGLERLLLLEDAGPEWGGLDGFALALPLRMQDETCGVLLLGPRPTGARYQADDVEFLTSLGSLALTSIENARGVAARIEKERLEEEMRLARDIQERLLPQDLPAFESLDLAGLALPSRFVAGDYYDLMPLDEDRLLVAIADVSGKGVPASLLMANLQACLHVLRGSLAAETVDLAAATARVNNVIHRNTGLTTFITFFWGVFDRRDGQFRFVNAGHNPPFLVRADDSVERLEEGGVLLGAFPDMPYASGASELQPGDTLVLFTDGVTEAWSAADDDDEYGEDRLLARIQAHAAESAQAVLGAVRDDVRRFTGGGTLDDDLTLVVLKRT
ncbi:MAG: SpoIIE family protein phosphatase [Bacteroidota bacterium]